MPGNLTNSQIVSLILEENKDTIYQDEDVIHMLLDNTVSKNINHKNRDVLSFGARVSDKVAKSVGSWPFIILFSIAIVIWIALNGLILFRAYDPYPYILLNLVLSCVAALQAPVIMMSQNRQEQKDRLRSENDYKTNLKAEIIIEDIHEKLDMLIQNQEKIMSWMAKPNVDSSED
ncbi:MAG: DUF1003 domain-containing protein [Christensenellales bacterium]